MREQPDQQDRRRGEEGEPSPPLSEWIAAAFGLLLLLGCTGFLLYDALTGDHQPPSPAVRITGIEAQDGRFLVRLRVVNQSRETASGLRIEGELRRGPEVVERSAMDLDYLPGRSSREGGLFFREDPRTLQLVVSPRSYQQP